MNQSESIANLFAALVKAQAKFPHIPKSKTVTVRTEKSGAYEFKYAPLEELIKSVRPILSENGLGFMQGVDDDKLVTTLVHESGEWKSHSMPLHDDPHPQRYGSQITYRRRYALKAILGVETDDDDEGAAALPPEKKSGAANADPWEKVPKERHEALRRLGNSIVDCFSADKQEEGWKAWREVTDMDEKLAVWKVLQGMPAIRRTLKKMDEAAREKNA